jgi:branched-chain amino acid transport system permease protein
MNIDIAIFLIKDGIGNGAIYSMIALGIVLIFNVTRIVLVSYGDLLAYSALTLAAIQSGHLPGTVWILLLFAAAALVLEIITILRRNEPNRLKRAVMLYGVVPATPAILVLMLQGQRLPMLLQVVLTVALIVPFGPLIYRVVFRPIADASVLVLLMAAVALHFVLSGLALQAFGAEGFRTKAYATGTTHVLGKVVPASLLVIVATVFAFILGLYFFFGRTILGKALRATAVNAVGARLVGIRPAFAGATGFVIAASMAAVSGVLIGPVMTIYYDTGFLVGLKGFVGAVVGGFISYPLAAVGALLIGLVESFSSFYASGFKDIIVFTMLVPMVILRWYITDPGHDEADDDEGRT